MHVRINNGISECDIHLIGTAHVSDESIHNVEKAIMEIDPDLIAVELDKDRFLSIMNSGNSKNADNIHNIDILKIIKEGKIGLFLIHTILANFQKKIGEQFGIKPGSEMKKAVDLAILYNKPVSLIDRPINITLSRAMNKMTLKEKIDVLLGLLTEKNDIEIDEKSLNNMINNAEDLILMLKEVSPAIYEVLVDERDKFMAKNIFESSKGKEKIVAVVGAGHLNGIANYLRELESGKNIDLGELMEVKKKSNILGKLASIGLVLLIIYGFYMASSNLDVLKKLTLDWILVNGSLSSLGVLIARGRIQTAIAAFLAAPITSLIPVIGAGYIAGLVELKYRKITVEDIKELFNTEDFKKLIKNNAMKVLIVAALANLGSAIGTFYFIPRFLGY
ncbi:MULTISPECIES: TraB/GumN family protein [Methanothermococcus]|uniref:TraB/GumN family protein n=1 Tax=Methanothermococcus TaxID=155862 RepID=UPI00037E453D|nr:MULTISPECIES: TraB/GumN family protein [Methanothermococcus]